MNNGYLISPPPPPIQIGFIVAAREFEFLVFINDNETILALKEEIQKYVSVEVERQTLTHDNEELEDDRTIESYDFDILNGALVPIRLIAAPAENENLFQAFPIMLVNYSVVVSETTTVAELKTLITENLGIPADTFDLYRLRWRMEDHRTLYDYHVGPWAQIEIRHI